MTLKKPTISTDARTVLDCQVIVTSNNVHEDTSNSQYGRTATMVFDRIISAIAGTGFDASGMGQ